MTDPRPITEHLHEWMTRQGIPTVDASDPDDVHDIRDDHLRLQAAGIERRWRQAIPQRFHRATLNDWAGEPWLPEAEAWSWDSTLRRNVVITGPVGVGKTHLAVAMCRAANDSGLRVVMAPMNRMLMDLRPGHDEDGAYMDTLLDVPRLIVDDVGMERSTDWTMSILDSIVEARWVDEYPTVFTTNLAAKELAEHVGARTYSRMVRGALVIRLSGEDRRGRCNGRPS